MLRYSKLGLEIVGALFFYTQPPTSGAQQTRTAHRKVQVAKLATNLFENNTINPKKTCNEVVAPAPTSANDISLSRIYTTTVKSLLRLRESCQLAL